MPNLTTYCRDSPLFLVHPVLQHRLDFLPRRLVLFFFFLHVIDREPGHPILCGSAIVFLDIYRGWDRHVRRSIDNIGIGRKRCNSLRVKCVRLDFERAPASFNRRTLCERSLAHGAGGTRWTHGSALSQGFSLQTTGTPRSISLLSPRDLQ